MKKLIIFILILSVALSLAACGAQPAENNAAENNAAANNSEPEAPAVSQDELEAGELLEKAMEGFKAVAPDKIKDCFLPEAAEAMEAYFAPLPEDYMEMLRDWASGMEYSVADLGFADDKAVAKLSITHADADNVLKASGEEYQSRALALIQKSDNPTTEKIAALLMECMQHTMEKTSPQTVTEEIGFPLIKTENGWKIANFTQDMADVMFSKISRILQIFKEE